VDVRVIAATNVDLQTEMAAGRFREDLYYRLQVVELPLPALRERTEDIVPLSRYFLRGFSARNHKPLASFAPEAEALLRGYSWPGNVRELENLIERAVIFAKGDRIEAHDLPIAARPTEVAASLGAVERQTIVRALDEHAGNISRAAAALGLSRAALYRRMAKHGIS
jgi:DNA-binding NtrC family response regulator